MALSQPHVGSLKKAKLPIISSGENRATRRRNAALLRLKPNRARIKKAKDRLDDQADFRRRKIAERFTRKV